MKDLKEKQSVHLDLFHFSELFLVSYKPVHEQYDLS